MKNLVKIAILLIAFNVNAQCFNQVTAGSSYVINLLNDGTLWSWGQNNFGQLGIGTNIDKHTPTKIGADTDWTFIASGEADTFAIKANGTLWGWGRNQYGQLGIGTVGEKRTPQQVGTDTDWKFVSNYGGRTIALKTDNTLWGWGSEPGPPEDPGFINSTTPVQIGTDTWTTICIGHEYGSAIKSDGTLWAWGFGILGNGSAQGWTAPMTQIGTDNQWKSVSCRHSHTIAIKQDGSLWGWGEFGGYVGDGTIDQRLVPTRIGNENDWASLETGYRITQAIKTNGSLWAWGNNGHGEIGDGTFINRLSPTRVGTDNNWEYIASGGFQYTMGIKNDNTLWGWGNNQWGQTTANGTVTLNTVPVMIDCTALGTVNNSQVSFSYYPNPVKDYLYLETPDAVKVEIYDISGRMLFAANIIENKINLTSLISGNYILKVYTENETLNTKIIKE